MEPIIINRTLTDKSKSAENRRRFIDRYKEVIRQSVSSGNLNPDKVTDGSDVSITIPKTIEEPHFRYRTLTPKELRSTNIKAKEEDLSTVYTGNRFFSNGEDFYVYSPEGNGQGGNGAGSGGGSQDSFSFYLSDKEFSDILFEGCKLPNFIKKRTKDSPEFNIVRAGFGKNGVPSRMNLVRSFNAALMRKIATRSVIEEEINQLDQVIDEALEKKPHGSKEISNIINKKLSLQQKLKKIIFLDDTDLRYTIFDKQPKPVSSAVIFFVLDVSGSMSEYHKKTAKTFFYLVQLFIKTKYKNVEVVFIRHTDTASECNQEEFFHAKDTGGTAFLPALKLVDEIITKKYDPEDYNIYVLQASDAGVFSGEVPECIKFLKKNLKSKLSYYFYMDIIQSRYEFLYAGGNDYREEIKSIGHTDKRFNSCVYGPEDELLKLFYKLFKP